MITLAVTVIKLITLRPLLEDRGHITKQSPVCHTHFCVRYSIKYFGEAFAPLACCSQGQLPRPSYATVVWTGPGSPCAVTVSTILAVARNRDPSRRPAGRWYDVRHDKQHCKIRADTVYRRRTCDARGHRFDRHIGRGSTTLGKLVTPSILFAAGVKPGR